MANDLENNYLLTPSPFLHIPSNIFDDLWRRRSAPVKCQSIQATIWPCFTKTHPKLWPQRFQIATGARLSSSCSKCIVGETPHGIDGLDEDELLKNIIRREEAQMGYVSLHSLHMNDGSAEVAKYCLSLLMVNFYGQTSVCFQNADLADVSEVLNLGLYLGLLDQFLRQFNNVSDFTGEEEEYLLLLRLTAMKRCPKGRESPFPAYKRLRKQSKRFVDIFRQRGVQSTKLETKKYWGTRQQLLAGKVIADWVDRENGPLDPIFGVLLQPTAGRVGPGDSTYLHELLFDDNGYMAYHSAVHDAFGYLFNLHNKGPGYGYIHNNNYNNNSNKNNNDESNNNINSVYSDANLSFEPSNLSFDPSTFYFDTNNPMAGQLTGVQFWQHAMDDIRERNKVINHWRI